MSITMYIEVFSFLFIYSDVAAKIKANIHNFPLNFLLIKTYPICFQISLHSLSSCIPIIASPAK